jgi:hypothetical protein
MRWDIIHLAPVLGANTMARFLAVFVVALAMTTNTAWADYTTAQYAAAVRRAADPNNDGRMTSSEWAFPDWRFSYWDENDDGVLSASEFQEFLGEIGLAASAGCDDNVDGMFTGNEVACAEGLLP